MDKRIYSNYGGIQIQELLAVKHGIKPVLRTVIKPENIESLKKICVNEGLSYMIKSFNQLYVSKFDSPINVIYISKSKGLLRKAHLSEKLGVGKLVGSRKLLGELLGYPSCCVEFFLEALKNRGSPYPIKTYLKTKGKPSFLANNIFKMESRLWSEELEVFQRNPDFANRISNLFLISHIPCSYTCKESVKIGREILSLLKGEEPELAKEIVSTLKKPLLFFDDFNWMIFDGKVNGNAINYTSILSPLSLMPENIVDKFGEGDKVKVEKEVVEIFKEGKIIHRIKKKREYNGILLDFS